MVTLIKWSSLPKHVSIFTPKKFYEIDPCSVQLLFVFDALTVFQITIDQVTIFQWDTLPKVIAKLQVVEFHSGKTTTVLWDCLPNGNQPSDCFVIRHTPPNIIRPSEYCPIEQHFKYHSTKCLTNCLLNYILPIDNCRVK